ncbi:hypothetical protein DFH09DRAFT_1506327 [Mycena vulgaris]|nr:hypothetical protein DFH09DRAFT_1506327 [Mycena vulgaris]
MQRALRVDELLNSFTPPPVPPPPPTSSGGHSAHVDIRPQLAGLAGFSREPGALHAPQSIQDHLNEVLDYLRTEQHPHVPEKATPPRTPAVSEAPIKHLHVQINPQTTLEILYEYSPNYVLEYPETSSTGSIGHLFPMDPDNWQDPALNIVYSRGGRMGQTVSGASVKCQLLLDTKGEPVLCAERHTTCEGAKICPNSNEEELAIPHTKASRDDVRDRLRKDREDRLQYVSPSRDIFLRTSAYLAALQKLGCSRPLAEVTNLSTTEEEQREARDLYLFQTKRGYRMKEGDCLSQESSRQSFDSHFYSCEHYNARTNKDHLNDHSIDDGSYHLGYIEAVISGDESEAAKIEDAVLSFGYGPLADCSTVSNCSQQKAYCPFPHRDETKNLIQPLMKRLKCLSKFRIFEPKEEYRRECPFVLIVTSGAHPHPVPLPTKTPPKIRAKLMEILGTLAEDLPDITPRRFIRHPSFSVINLKAQQDRNLAKEQRYIRRIIAIPLQTLNSHEEDEPEKDNKDDMVRIIICMTPEASRRLLSAGRYLQSDIAFRRIVRFLEFELACMDRDANTSLIFCRVYINRQTAAAHQRVFEEIEAIVKEDTGKSLRWRHLHATSINGSEGYDGFILSWTADQHRGQAKGLGLHLQKLASNMPVKADLHQAERTIQELDPYDHLRRILRICVVHDFRNINKCPVAEDVRWLMRSLVCIEHDDWEGTLLKIRDKGGKAGNDWVNDKQFSKFFFPGICWEQSFIPLDIWNAGDPNSNLIESVHRDVNREGVHCTLLGGLKKGQLFDALKMKTLITYENYGITPSYKTGHISENAHHNLKRKSNAQHRVLAGEDDKIERYNEKVLKCLDSLVKAEKGLRAKERELLDESRPEKRQKIEDELEKKRRAEERARKAFEKQQAERDSLKKGSGKVALVESNMLE